MDFMIEKASNAFLTIKKSQPIFIKVDNEVLFNSIEVISNDIRSFQCIGQCIRLFPDGESLKIEFKLDGDIDDRIKALKFMCGLLNKKEIYFGDSKLECNYEETSLDLNNLKNTLVFYEKIKKVLNYFHIKSKYDLSDYDDNRMKILLDIYDCIFENKQVELLFPNNGAAILKIFGLNLLCTINSENKRSFISNYFDDRNRINIKDLDGNTLVENESTYFSLYDINNNPFFIVDNIDLDEMYKQLFTKELNNHKKGLANSILLNLISYYDKIKNKDVLNYIIKFSKKLNDISNDQISKINYLQCIIRKRELNNRELKELNDIINASDDSLIICGCYLIKKDIKGFENELHKLSTEKINVLKKFPIYNIYLSLRELNSV